MTVIVRGELLIDGTGADPVSGPTVVCEGDRFIEVGTRTPVGSETIDLDGCTLLPGLIDAHSHTSGAALDGDRDRTPAAVMAAYAFRHLGRMLDLGFTTTRDTGGADGGLAMALDLGLARGPRLIPCGPILTQTGGHADFRPPYVADPCQHHLPIPGLSLGAQNVDGIDAMRAAARMAFKRGARFLKLCVTGGVTSQTDGLEDTQFSVEEIRTAVEEANARHTYVTVHTHNKQGIMNALAAGATCFEHATGLDEEAAEAIKSLGGAIVPTLTVAHIYHSYDFVPESIRARISGVEAGMANAAKLGLAAGILVGSGADLIGPNQTQYGMEIPLKAQAIGAMQAITSATSVNAKILRMADDIGSVQPGKLADLIAVRGNPLEDPWLLADPDNIALVVKAGQIVKSDHLKP